MKNFFFSVVCISATLLFSQEGLIDKIDNDSIWGIDENAAFKGLKIVNFESTKLVAKNDFYFIVSHRFSSIKNGFDDFFGLDNAVTRLQFVYGITDNLNVGVSRSSFQKVYDVAVKYGFVQQKEEGAPVNIAAYGILGINTFLDEDFDPTLSFSDKLIYTAQLLISRRMTEKLSLEVMPTYLYESYVFFDQQENPQAVLGLGGRYKLGKRWSVNTDYAWHLNRASGSPFKNALSVGVDIETGGHVFQMHFTNAQPMTESGFIGQATGDWGRGDIFFGFNLSRVF